MRDSEGVLLLQNGKRDGRSTRGKKGVGGGGGGGGGGGVSGGKGSASARGKGEKSDVHERLMRQIFPGRGKVGGGG